MRRKQLWLCVPPVIVCLFDNVLTLWSQPASYWEGRFASAHEAAPHGRWLLAQHPLAFEGAMLVYVVIFCFLIVRLPRLLAMVLSTAIVLGHLTGACTWIAFERPADGYWLTLGVCVFAAALLVTGYLTTEPPPQPPEADTLATPNASPREAAERYREPFSSN
jgi:hypothetical protein